MGERLHLDYSGTTEPPVEIEAYLRVLEEETPKGWRRLCSGLENGCVLAQASAEHFDAFCANRGRNDAAHLSCMKLHGVIENGK